MPRKIVIILCLFPYYSIVYTVVRVYYFPGNRFNTISSGAITFYVGFQNFCINPLNIVALLTIKVVIGDHPTRLKKTQLASN